MVKGTGSKRKKIVTFVTFRLTRPPPLPPYFFFGNVMNTSLQYFSIFLYVSWDFGEKNKPSSAKSSSVKIQFDLSSARYRKALDLLKLNVFWVLISRFKLVKTKFLAIFVVLVWFGLVLVSFQWFFWGHHQVLQIEYIDFDNKSVTIGWKLVKPWLQL